MDFGISLRQSDWQRLTPSSQPIGTPGYMSPQRQRGEEPEACDDVYSLGIVLYECLSGRLPGVGEYQALNTLNEAIPPAIDDLILSCLRENKALRLSSATDFFLKLTKALQPHASFAEILSRGSLSELNMALSQIDSLKFAELDDGKRIVIMVKVKGLIKVDQFDMRNVVASLLSELVRVGYRSPEEDYAFVIEQSFNYGYEKQYNGTRRGNVQIREALNHVAFECHEPAHRVISDKLLFFLESLDWVEEREGWYYHDFGILLQNLLVNDSCAPEYALRLGKHFEKVNQLSR